MKKSYIIVFFILISSSQSLYSVDSTITKYYPLKIGNSWTYLFNYYSNYGNLQYRIRYYIADTVNINNHKYFKRRQIGDTSTVYLRVDSLSGNLLEYLNSGCGMINNIRLRDSLNSKRGDSSNASCYRTICTDTGLVSIFNYNVKSKNFSFQLGPSGGSRKYALDIGKIFDAFGTGAGGSSFYETYDLIGCVIDGNLYGDTNSLVGIGKINSEVPADYGLFQNYPNPFNPFTKIRFDLPKSSAAKLIVFDILGREIAILIDEQLKPGSYQYSWDGTAYASGIYFYQLITDGNIIDTKKMVLMK